MMIESNNSLFEVEVDNYNGPLEVLLDLALDYKNFISKSYLGICRQFCGLLGAKSDFWPKNGYVRL